VTRPQLHPVRLCTLGLAGLVACAALAACALPGQRRQDALMRTAREFNDGLRWGRDDQVLACLDPVEAKALQTRRSDLGDDFAMADQEVKSVKFIEGADANKATVLAEFTWYRQSQSVVKRSTVEQQWTWTGDHWTLSSWKRIAGERFPLVPEPVGARK